LHGDEAADARSGGGRHISSTAIRALMPSN